MRSFKGISRDEFIDCKEFREPIYEQIEEAYQFVLQHINLSAQINGIVRRDIYELPVREAIINAVTHRSYMDDSCVQVSIYDDRIEVLSPGMLYGGLDMEAAFFRKIIREDQHEGRKEATSISIDQRVIDEKQEMYSESGKKENPAIRCSDVVRSGIFDCKIYL